MIKFMFIWISQDEWNIMLINKCNVLYLCFLNFYNLGVEKMMDSSFREKRYCQFNRKFIVSEEQGLVV